MAVEGGGLAGGGIVWVREWLAVGRWVAVRGGGGQVGGSGGCVGSGGGGGGFGRSMRGSYYTC